MNLKLVKGILLVSHGADFELQAFWPANKISTVGLGCQTLPWDNTKL